jgi:hypothetical protein
VAPIADPTENRMAMQAGFEESKAPRYQAPQYATAAPAYSKESSLSTVKRRAQGNRLARCGAGSPTPEPLVSTYPGR